jgi:hypothetical protein
MPQSKRTSSRSKLPVLERYTKATKPKGPSKYNSAAARITDDYDRKDYSDEFMNLINGISDAGIVLPSFARFLGRDGLLPIIRRRGDKVPSDYSGIVYNTGHWTGYENGKEEYNSYTDNLQIKGTDNYCQSFATYLWAKKGDLEPFVKGEYIENVQRMSKIWLSYFDSIKGAELKEVRNSFEEDGPDNPEGQNLKAGLITLQKLVEKDYIAQEFSISKYTVKE